MVILRDEYPVIVPFPITFHCGASVWRDSFVFRATDFLATFFVFRSILWFYRDGLVPIGVLERDMISELSPSESPI